MAHTEEQYQKIRRALVAIVDSDDIEELKKMKDTIASSGVAYGEGVKVIAAIDALIETWTPEEE